MASQRPTPKRTQMADLARMAGVSASTVSRALSGHPAIAPATRQRISELARSLNYQINAGAANLRKRTVQTVGVVMLTDSMQQISDPFILKLIGHIADQLDQRDLGLLLRRLHPDQAEDVGSMVDRGEAGGLIVIGQASHHQAINAVAIRGVPMMVWGAKLADSAYPVVGSDNEQGGYLATRHLIQQGCQRIAILGEHHHPEAQLRYRGHQLALKEAGLKPQRELDLTTPFGADLVRQQFSGWLDKGLAFDGLFCMSDVAAISAVAVMTERGIKVPRQVKVVGYDDITMSAYLHPSITTVRQPTELAGKALVNGLFDQIEGRPTPSVTLPTDLIVRESSQR